MTEKLEIIKKLKSDKNKVISDLVKYLHDNHNIHFYDGDGELENVIFENDEKKMKISWDLFYRYSGMIKYFKPTGTKGKVVFGQFEIITDDMFYDRMKLLILYSFGIDKV